MFHYIHLGMADRFRTADVGGLVDKTLSRVSMTRRQWMALLGAAGGARLLPAWASTESIAPQPYFAEVMRAVDALAKLGSPVAADDAQQLAGLARQSDAAAVAAAERLLDRYTLTRVLIDAVGTTETTSGGAVRNLVEQGWRLFLVRIANPAPLAGTIEGPAFSTVATMSPAWTDAQRAALWQTLNKAPLVANMWIKSELHEPRPLSGSAVEYRVIQLFSRDRGKKTAKFGFYVGADAPTPASTHVNSKTVLLEFDCLPSRSVQLGILDVDGQGCVASVTVKDAAGRVYPPQAMRLAPDLRFQPQIYRGDGESLRLPDGEYSVKIKRGPEYLVSEKALTVNGEGARIDVKLQRWIDPADWGWYCGETHIHASGCAHYDNPTEGVTPETIIRHVRGEALWLGEVLTWAGGYQYQKNFFTGHPQSPDALLEHSELQEANGVSWQPHRTPKDADSQIRYDIEVAGFPSSMFGHLILLRLKDQDYPGTKRLEDWPCWNLPILKWAKAQGCVTGYTHCALGLQTNSMELPSYEIPSFDSIGANEAIIDVAHEALDFISCGTFAPLVEMNLWYHILNCGFRLVMVGETDYPCFVPPTDSRAGMGRTYVRLDAKPTGEGGYDAWINNLQKGRLYFSEGRSHFVDFRVNGHASGDPDVLLKKAGSIDVTATVAARLELKLSPEQLREANESIWHLEFCRIGSTREVPLELIVNGKVVERMNFLADGTPRKVQFKTKLARSAWIALRILPSGHTHPVFVRVNDRPVRASRRSAQWCRDCIDKVWEVKSPLLRESERQAAQQAFDQARGMYDRIVAESDI